MKKTLLIIAFLAATNLFAQQRQDSILVKEISTIKNNVFQQRQEIDVLTQKLKNQENVIGKQKKNIETLKNTSKSLNASIDSLNQSVQNNSQNIVSNSNELGLKIEQTDKSVNSNNSKISALDDSLSKNQLYWIIATLVILILGGLLYWFLGKRMRSNKNDIENQIKSSKTDVETQIRNTKTALEEESVKLDNKLVEVLETQLKVQQTNNQSKSTVENEEIDHSLALKVASEIVRMQKNIARMDEKTKGLKPLQRGIERIRSNFSANGYEMTNLLNKKFDDRMTIDVVNVIEDENIVSDEKIITKIIKPQVLYNEKLIQRAQVEVSQN